MRRTTAVLAGVLAIAMASTLVVVAVAAGRPGVARYGHMWGGEGPASTGWSSMHGGPMTGVQDEFGYLAEMVAHHREAVVAARELERSDRPAMRAFGASIVRTQSAQVDQMLTWLGEWYPGRSLDVGYQPMMRDLSGLTGDALDRAFLLDMVPHHMMAVMMSQQLLVRGLADHGEVETLAREIRDEQRAEIVRMHRWLARWFADALGSRWRHGMAMPGMWMPGMGPCTDGWPPRGRGQR